MKTFVRRMLGASHFDVATYEEVEADRTSTAAAVAVAVTASVAAAIGTGVRGFTSLAAAASVLLMTWLVWVILTYIIGTRLFPEPDTHADIGEVVRTTGFSAAPGILYILGLVPVIGLPILLGITVWMLFTFIVAVRQALDYRSSARALAVCVLGWLIHGILLFGFVRVAI